MLESIHFDNNKKILSIETKTLSYHAIDCYETVETYELIAKYSIWKMIYQFIFAAVLPVHEILDDNYSKSNKVICKQLYINLFIQGKTEPIHIDLLPKNKPCSTKKKDFITAHDAFLSLKNSLDETFKMLYGNEFQSILSEKLSHRKK